MPKLAKAVGYIGVDPGASGGLACLTEGQLIATPMPNTETDVYDWFVSRRLDGGELFAVIEQVTGYVGDGGNPGSAMFSFGRNVGMLRAFLIASAIPFESKIPRTWQKGLGIVPRDKSESKGQWKNRLKSRAQELFPEAHITLGTADAILIAEWCRRSREGEL